MNQISEVISPGGVDQVSIERQNALHAYAISKCEEFVFGFVPRSQTNRINGRKNTRGSVSKTTFGSKATPLYPLLLFNSEPPIGANVLHPGPATRNRATSSRMLCSPNRLFWPPLCCRCPDVQKMVDGNVARGCLSECSTRELWAV
jgi:hypothetical protein